MKRLIIAIDCDDVLVPTAERIINYYNDTYGTSLTLGHMYKPASFADWGTDKDDVAIERVNDFLRSDEHATIAPSEETVQAVKKLAAHHELHLITGRADFLAALTKQMVGDYFDGCFTSIEHTNYIVSSTSTAVRRTKGEVCRAINADILIDDHLEHGRNVLDAGIKKVILFGNYPWNQSKALPAGSVRCTDWGSVVAEVDRASRQ